MLTFCPYSGETQFSSWTLRAPYGPGLRTIIPIRVMVAVAVLRPVYIFFHMPSRGEV